MSRTVRLDPDQLDELAAAIARHLRAESKPSGDGLVDAATVARELGVSRSFVYQHSEDLGARRLNGRGRLRFDREQATAAFAAMESDAPARQQQRRRRSPVTSHVLASRPQVIPERAA